MCNHSSSNHVACYAWDHVIATLPNVAYCMISCKCSKLFAQDRMSSCSRSTTDCMLSLVSAYHAKWSLLIAWTIEVSFCLVGVLNIHEFRAELVSAENGSFKESHALKGSLAEVGLWKYAPCKFGTAWGPLVMSDILAKVTVINRWMKSLSTLQLLVQYPTSWW